MDSENCLSYKLCPDNYEYNKKKKKKSTKSVESFSSDLYRCNIIVFVHKQVCICINGGFKVNIYVRNKITTNSLGIYNLYKNCIT